MSREPLVDPVDVQEILRRHLALSPGRPVSYLPIGTLERAFNLRAEDYEAKVHQAGLECVRVDGIGSTISSFGLKGAIYAYHKEGLMALIERNRSVISKSGWPTDTRMFIAALGAVWNHDTNSPVFQVIAEAFGASESNLEK